MPPKTRARVTKASKENIKNGAKKVVKASKVTKPARKALADKTNSASDDNASVEVPIKVKKTVTAKVVTDFEDVRPRRERRLPTRFIENQVLTSLTNSKEESVNPKPKINERPPSKNDKAKASPIKTPSSLESSLVANRPSRVCRLPSRFDDHSVSPHRFVPVQPCYASTPKHVGNSISTDSKNKAKVKSTPSKLESAMPTTKKSIVKSVEKSSPDTNNNPKKSKRLHAKKLNVINPSPVITSGYNSSEDLSLEKLTHKVRRRAACKKEIEVDVSYKLPTKKLTLKTKKVASPKKPDTKVANKLIGQRFIDRNTSFKVLEDKKKSPNKQNGSPDVYEFTFDPDEEPPPQKKKKKQVRKKPAKPKPVLLKSNYDQNLSKALRALKNTVAKKTEVAKPTSSKSSAQVNAIITNENIVKITNPENTGIPVNEKQHIPEQNKIPARKDAVHNDHIPVKLSKPVGNTNQIPVHTNNHVSIHVEDIAADFATISDNHDVLNYSPVNTPRPLTPTLEKSIHTHDPLNLQDNMSFFDGPPVASSSMNVSARDPLASPWRVEFGSLPIKWHANTYVKANMTPAVESSFINNYDNSRKKHVYTNMVAETNETLPELVEKHLKQTSIISFIREVVERSASKKKRGRSVTPTKENSLFENLPETVANISDRTPKKAKKNKSKTPNSSTEIISVEKGNQNKSNSVEKRTNQIEKEHTFFGFDESENQDDQENVSPVKVPPQVRALRPRFRAVLHEINAMSRPTRAAAPAKSKMIASSDVVNKVYEELKSATDAPVFPEKEVGNDTTNLKNGNDPSWTEELENDDSQSVHLFEDIEVVHHLKPTRKSYGKAKKVTFRARSVSDSDSQTSDHAVRDASSDEDDLADLSFQVPNIKEKRIRKRKNTKKLMSKKEEKEADAWAACFNSMCEDIEEFPLVVE